MAKILVLGSGMVGSAMSLDLASRHEVIATDRSAEVLQRFDGVANIETKVVDVADAAAVTAAVAGMDLVVSAVPGFLGFATLRTLIEAGKNVADISFFPEDALELCHLAQEKGVVVVTDIGVAPGLDNLILGYHDAQMKVQRFECLVGGLPKKRTFPWQYKAPFSPMDVVEEYLRPARVVENGREVVMPALSEPEYVDFEGIGTLEAFNTDGLRSLIHTMSHVPDMVEKTLRFPGHRDLALALRESGFLSDDAITVNGQEVIPREVTSAILFDQWKLHPGEEEFTIMRVTVEGQEDGKTIRHVWNLYDEFDPETGISSMSRTTGYTCTGMAECILDGAWKVAGLSPGEVVGRNTAVFERLIQHLAARGVTLRHETVAIDD
ncbi:MAG: saccharopine dehydrogenase NADP-binding domain-containing protein [Planctomycetota bacterium]|nr:saccharopine dehydrogenase NADP-binding domain-containing protein [Planctomycetota bacterium]MDA1113319.1 saccharopine dehydrogenase NADP-binding domain-containing protein [Planctomycetota bacterium]